MLTTDRRVLRLLARGFVLYQVNATAVPDEACLDWGPVTELDRAGRPHPDTVEVSRPMFRRLREAGYVVLAREVDMGRGQVDRTWVVTDAGKEACR